VIAQVCGGVRDGATRGDGRVGRWYPWRELKNSVAIADILHGGIGAADGFMKSRQNISAARMQMRWFDNLKVGQKLAVMMGSALTMIALLGLFAGFTLSTVNQQSADIATNSLPSVEAVGGLNAVVANIRVKQYRHVSSTSADEKKQVESSLDALTAKFADVRRAYEQLNRSDIEKAKYAEFSKDWDAYWSNWTTDILPLSRRSENERALTLIKASSREDFDKVSADLDALVKLGHDGATAASARASKIYVSSTRWMTFAVMLAALLGFALTAVVTRGITNTVGLLLDRANSLQSACITGLRGGIAALAGGDTSVVVTAVTKQIGHAPGDEIGDLSRTIDQIIADVQTTVLDFTRTQQVVRGVLRETQQLSQAAQDGRLAERADANRYEGDFRELLRGMNGTLEAVAAPIGEAKSVLGRVADRDLTVRMVGQFRGEYGEIERSINRALESLSDTLSQTNAASVQVAAAAAQITSGSESLASTSSEQAANLEEVAASVQEFSSMTKASADNARTARDMANSARSHATDGSARMERLTSAVAEIKNTSGETAKIVKTIEEIAFQTNLLALNAAVEAARAGDAGRGFAVVADEVRALAIRSAEAAKMTADLIERGLGAAERGVAINQEVIVSLQQITTQVIKVTDVIAEISLSAEQQAQSVTQINAAVEELNQVTQQVAANAEESASAAAELDSQAASLRETIGTFALSHNQMQAHSNAAFARSSSAGSAFRSTPRTTKSAKRGAKPAPTASGVSGGSRGAFDDPNDDCFLGF